MSKINISPIVQQLKLLRKDVNYSNSEVRKIREEQENRVNTQKKKVKDWRKVEAPEEYPLVQYNLKKLNII